jgi:hypothetical protein
MITCPWCGTSYIAFISNCRNCGGPLPLPARETETAEDTLLQPPSSPRPINDAYIWRLLAADGGAIAALVFVLLGIIFTPLGIFLTLGVITAFVGIPFLGLGLIFLAGGITAGIRRVRTARQQVNILQMGEAVEGHITQMDENRHVLVNGRHPWNIRYQFELNGQTYEGQVETLNVPGATLAPGKRACILYLPQSPERNVLYPHP